MSDPIVGSVVLVNNKHKAVVRYVGTTSFAEGTWYGLELEREIGKHEGTVLGVTYFSTPKKRGTFVKRENLTLYTEETEASAKMQSAMRMSLAKKRVKAEASWRAFNALDADEENRILARRQRLMSSALGARLTRDRLTPGELEALEKEADGTTVEADYAGPHLTFPLTLEQVMAMVRSFKDGYTLHYKYAMALLCRYRRYANDLPTMVEVSHEPGTRFTVCGDTHGQLQDLYSIFTLNGVPSPTNRYLMNGDFVDRGDYSCEIVFTLIAFCLLYPGEPGTGKGAGCLLNRGNHETHNQNLTGGFMSEVLDKYSAQGDGSNPEIGLKMYDVFQSTFDSMPIAHLFRSGPNTVFIVHGGLMQRPGVTLEHVASIKRRREIPYGLPGFEDKLYEELMWSDPRNPAGTTPSDRGAGVFFGPDVTHGFCETNNINLVVRSHECVSEGYMYMHDDMLLTVFSASRYCGRGTNKGSYIIFLDGFAHVIQQYVAAPLDRTDPALLVPAMSAAQQAEYEVHTAVEHGLMAPLIRGPDVAQMEDNAGVRQDEAVRRMILERVVLYKPDLYFYWSKIDRTTTNTGCITKSQWADGMRIVLALDLPWLSVAPSLCDMDAAGRINYSKFLDRYCIAMRDSDTQWMDNIIERACNKLYSACHTLEEAYKFFDTDGSGVIEFEELERGLMKMDIGLSRTQVVDLMNSMDTDRDGRIEFVEFANRFRLLFSQAEDDSSSQVSSEAHVVDASTADALQLICKRVTEKHGGNFTAAFSACDSDGDGLINLADLHAGLLGLELSFPEDQVTKIMSAMDDNGSGAVSLKEFRSALVKTGGAAAVSTTGAGAASRPAAEQASSGSWQQSIIERVVAALYEYRVELGAAFRMFDTNGDGVISKEEFRVGLQALTSVNGDGSVLTEMQCDEMLKALDTDGNGEISYAEFVDAFRIIERKE